MEKLIVKGEKSLSGTIGISGSKNATLAILAATILSNKKIISYGATYKSATIFNYCNIGTNFIDYVIDTTPNKQGKFTPGKHVPIISPENEVAKAIYRRLHAPGAIDMVELADNRLKLVGLKCEENYIYISDNYL
mgnify:CR=1 FL=1